ncbi:MAG: PKD domain-containing protein [Planctomycetales bacterium]|nr:PKD domain-containing protein [Planctomycetales bacterium]
MISRKGLSFIEVTISTMLVGLLFVGSLRMLAESTRAALLTQDRIHATRLADQLLREIIALPYEDPNESAVFGSEASELPVANRSNFDDVDDYHNWQETPPRDKNGNDLGYSGWQWSVQVAYVDPASLTSISASDLGVKQVMVSVIRPGTTIAAQLVGYQSQSSSTYASSGIDTTDFDPSTNRPPLANLRCESFAVPSGSTIKFDASQSSDPDGDALNFVWNFGDGSSSTLVAPTHTFTNTAAQDVSCLVELTVVDPFGASNTTTLPIAVFAE